MQPRPSALKAIQIGSADTSDLRRMLNKRAGKTTLLWIPGRHGIAGNEEADACAKQAATIIDGAPRPVSFAAASALIRRTLKACRTKRGLLQDDFMAGRLSVCLLARLRAVHIPSSRLTQIGSTRLSTLNALFEERSRRDRVPYGTLAAALSMRDQSLLIINFTHTHLRGSGFTHSCHASVNCAMFFQQVPIHQAVSVEKLTLLTSLRGRFVVAKIHTF